MKLKAFIIAMCMCLFIVGAAWAVPFPVDLNYSNIAGDTGITYATVYGSVDSATSFLFDIKVSDGFLMRNFYFNTDIAGLTASNISLILPLGYTAVVNYNHIAADGFGKFDISMEKTGQHNVTELTFLVTGLPLGWSADDFYQPSTTGPAHFAAQIWDTVNDPTGANTFFARDGGTSKVPEPNTMILLGTGLLGLALYGRRKFRK